mgnify:CR=1 FL=1
MPFSFEEICIIAPKMEISIDRLVGLSNNKRAFFDQKMYQSSEPADIFRDVMRSNTEIIRKVREAGKNAEGIFVLNRIPLGFSLAYETLTKFFYYKWTYHIQKGGLETDFDDFVMPEETKKICDEYNDETEHLSGNMTMIIDENIFLYMIREINYFYRRRLLERRHVLLMQQELEMLANELELLARRGTNRFSDAKVMIYLSEIDLEPSHFYTDCNGVLSVHYWTALSEPSISYDEELCRRHREWIESQKRYTILITQCNELQQIAFFNKQKKYLQEMVDSTAEHRVLNTSDGDHQIVGEVGKWC